LEQTVAELGAALVVAKTKVEAAVKTGSNLYNNAEKGFSKQDEHLKAQLQDSQDEIETLRAQLSLERQRCSTLHRELQDLSKEQADELSSAHARQRQYERKISDLSTTVAKLQSSSSSRRSMHDNLNDYFEDINILGESSTNATDRQHSGDEMKETDHLRKQMASLSEKVFEQQSKIDHSRAEISTLKNRLQAAVRRADAAEKSLEDANQRLIMMEAPSNAGIALSGTMSSTDEETGTKPRRRSGPVRKGFQRTSQVESIRSALGLHHGRLPIGGCQEGMAQLLDTVDSISIDLGSHFRYSPISRLAFITYLIILHMWAFFLVVFHAHAQGTVGGDHYGPEALLHSYRHMEQMPRTPLHNP
jgi:predicted  nucleic acid-binding Zn-ribbon protein